MPENSVSEIARQGFAEQNRFSETAHSRRATAVCASLHRRRLAAPERSGDLEQNRREAVCMTSVGQMDRVRAIHDRKATGVEEVILRGAFANDLSSTFHQQPP